VAHPPEAVWAFFSAPERVVTCLPGASLTRPPQGDDIDGKMSVKLGPIIANFAGQARIARDDANQRGVIMGAGTDQLGGSRTAGEAEYQLRPTADGGTEIALTVRALLSGPLAQFGRAGIVENLAARITEQFAQNLEARLSGKVSGDDQQTQAPLAAGSLLGQVIAARVKSFFAKVWGRQKP
jgi:carbon-monoxide dehydrogenase small subunit